MTTNQFFAFYLLLWLPCVLIGGTGIVEAWQIELAAMSGMGQAFVWYLWCAIFFGPMLYKAFFAKSGPFGRTPSGAKA